MEEMKCFTCGGGGKVGDYESSALPCSVCGGTGKVGQRAAEYHGADEPQPAQLWKPVEHLSRLDEFAKAAMQGEAANPVRRAARSFVGTAAEYARQAYDMAEAMIAEGEKRRK